jgi:hypothetical protein
VAASVLIVAAVSNGWCQTDQAPATEAATRVALAPGVQPSAVENAVPQGAISTSRRGPVIRYQHTPASFPMATLPLAGRSEVDATAPDAAPLPPGLLSQSTSLHQLPASSISPRKVVNLPKARKLASRAPLRIATLPVDERPLAPTVVVEPPAKAVATPSVLGSRHRDMLLLQQLEADLARTDDRLKSVNEKLSEGQRQLLKLTGVMQQAMMEAGPDAYGLHPFVRVSQRYAGTPYVWGGESGRGFDCSGLIMLVMRDLGYPPLPHSAAEQFSYGKPIAKALLKPGDLVFFKNTYKRGISHVGIYLGRDRFIHAAGTGKGTIVSSLSSAKFTEHYAGARRLIPARRS